MSRTAQVCRTAVFSVVAAAVLTGGLVAGAVSGGHGAAGAAGETLSSGSLTGPVGINIGWDSVPLDNIGWDAVPLDNIGWDSPGTGRATAGTPTQADTCSSSDCT
ncbi:hypothetical protein [Streptomyces sp. enrichment culture]|uniref:hypothetical protein n=1 Tax=Streptomyces sp. enrichment culture TaxID=1795815 RepID=UPI003F556AAE